MLWRSSPNLLRKKIKSLEYVRLFLAERETQKGIVIGHKGEQLKVGIAARKRSRIIFGKKIHIELFVKVQKKLAFQPSTTQTFWLSAITPRRYLTNSLTFAIK